MMPSTLRLRTEGCATAGELIIERSLLSWGSIHQGVHFARYGQAPDYLFRRDVEHPAADGPRARRAEQRRAPGPGPGR